MEANMFGIIREDSLGLMRKRKGWTQAYFSKFSSIDNFNLFRYDKKLRSPREKDFNNYMNSLGLPIDTCFYSYLNVQNTFVFEIRNQLLFELEWARHYPHLLISTETLITKLKGMDGFDNGINLQFILYCTAKLHELQGRQTNEIVDMIKDAISITYPEFKPDNLRGDMLFLPESELILLLALVYHRSGDLQKGVSLLEQMLAGLIALPQDSRSKERLFAPVLLGLAQMYLDAGEYDKAIKMCDEGRIVSNRRNRGKYTPDFTFIKAKTVYSYDKKECANLLLPAYASYSLMRKQGMAIEVKEFASQKGISFETYDIENLATDVPDLSIKYGTTIPCTDMGGLFYGFRKEASLCDGVNISLRAVCEGICDKSTLNDLENKSKPTSIFIYEGLFDRYGRCGEKYFTVFYSFKDGQIHKLRNNVNALIAQGCYAKVKPLHSELSKIPFFMQKGIGLQYIKYLDAQIYCREKKYDTKHMEMLKDAWYATGRKYDEDHVSTLRLTYSEISTLNQIGINLCETGQRRRGVRLLENLHTSINRHYVDEMALVRTMPTLKYNLSKHIGLMGALDDALQLSIEGSEMCIKHGNLNMSASFAINRAYVELESGDKKKGVSIFAQAFHALGLVDNTLDQDIVRLHVKKRHSIDFR